MLAQYLMKGNVVLVKVDETHILLKNRLWLKVMIKIFPGLYPTSVSNHFLLMMQIIKVLNPHTPSEE